MDLSKAFDTVDHLLSYKVSFYNFESCALNLIKSYLKNRSIKLIVNCKLSHAQPIRICVPQGSVLGPFLFIIFFNDLLFLNTYAKPKVFADDTTISASGKTTKLIIHNIESDLKQIQEWLDNNKQVINVKKLQAMFINSNQKILKKTLKELKKIKINCNGKEIKFETQVKLLGVTIDNKLSFDRQSSNITKKVNSKTFLLKKPLPLQRTL